MAARHRTQQRYEDIGALHNALNAHDAQILDSLTKHEQAIAETVFRALVDGSTPSFAVRRTCQFKELVALAEGDHVAVTRVLDAFHSPDCNFLRPPFPEPLTDKTIIDLSHESLIRQWQTLKTWTEQETESAAIYQRLLENAVLHEQGEFGFYRTPELENALSWHEQNQPTALWAERYGGQFELATAFLQQSLQAQQRELQ